MKQTVVRLATVLTLGLTLAGVTACGSTPGSAGSTHAAAATDPAPAEALDPCTILDDAALGRALGTPVRGGGTADARAGGLSCTWTYDDPGSAVGEGELVLTTFHGAEFFAPGTIGEPLPGIGDEAQVDRSLGVVLFRSGDDVVEVHVLSGGFHDRAEPVADAVAANL